MNFEQARFNMVEQQVRPWDVLDQDILDLMMSVKREDFVPPACLKLAFAETAIPLGHGAAMLPPALEAKLLQALQLRKSDKVLEIGAGSGYMAALLAGLAEQVTSVEIVPELAAAARANLERAEVDNAMVIQGDGMQGWANNAPYDLIVLSGSTPVLPQALLQQLKPGGRLFAFVGEAPLMEAQLVTCTAAGVVKTTTVFETIAPVLANVPQPERFRF